MPKRTITVKVSEEEFELIQQARDALRKKGLEDAEIGDKEVEEFNWGTLALGAIAGIGAYLLIRKLLEE